jgi:hypothetical protein
LVGSSLLTVGLFGCSTLAKLGIAVPHLGDPSPTRIDLLNQKPEGTPVYLRGVVTDGVPFLDGGAYQLKDDSGTIWIRTDTPRVPEKGTEIVVKGQVESRKVPEGAGEGNEFYVRESERMEPTTIAPSRETPPTPPAAKPVSDSLDGFFLPHKRGNK